MSVHREMIERMERQHYALVDAWRERADAAECRAETSAAALADLVNRILTMIPVPAPSAPWWERWFGLSRRSDIRQ